MKSYAYGRFNGTGAALRIGLGFKPDRVIIVNLEDAGGLAVALHWSRFNTSADQEEGVLIDSSGVRTELTHGNGIAIYRGGESFAATQTAYLYRDPSPDKRSSGTTGNTVASWTLDTAGNRTGHFDVNIGTSYVGEGSRVIIRESSTQLIKEGFITALSNDGDAANDVTLNEALKSGTVLFIGPMYDYTAIAAKRVMPDGIIINETGTLNASGEMCSIEAWAI